MADLSATTAPPSDGVPSDSADTPLQRLCDQIRAQHRRRVFAMDQRKRADNALGAFLRTDQGWSRDLDKVVRLPIEERAQRAIAAGEARAGLKALTMRILGAPEDKREALLKRLAPKQLKLRETVAADPLPHMADVIDAAIAARAPFDLIEDQATKRLEELAEQLPVWAAWAKGVYGFSARALGTIVAEAGNLDDYEDRGQLWKRMGLAVMDGMIRQGGLPKSAKAAVWVEHGYSARRRSMMWVIGGVLVKQGAGPYRVVYDARKAYELEAAARRGQIVEPASARTKNNPKQFMSVMHVHRRAQRYTEKRLLRDLLREWRKASRAILIEPPIAANSPLPSDADGGAAAMPSRYLPEAAE